MSKLVRTPFFALGILVAGSCITPVKAQQGAPGDCAGGPTLECAETESEATERQPVRQQAETESERQAAQFIAALDALSVSSSAERSSENLSPRDVVNEARSIFEELLNLPMTKEGADKAGELGERLKSIEDVVIGMRNSAGWEPLSEAFFDQRYLLAQAISTKRNEIFRRLSEEAPQRFEELKAEADRMAERYESEIASLSLADEHLDATIVLRVTLFGESPMAWLTARQWLAMAMYKGVNIVDARTTSDGLAFVVKNAGEPSVTFLLSSDYGELYVSAVRIRDQHFVAINHQRRFEFERLFSRVVGYSRT